MANSRPVSETLAELSIPEPNSGCLLWTGAHNERTGYGMIYLKRTRDGAPRKTRRAHQVAYELAHGPIPKGMVVRHKCDVRLCIEPKHLEIGTVLDNLSDMYSRGRNGQHKRRGEAHTDSKLTNEQRLHIYRSPEPGTILSARFGVSRSVISRIRTGKNAFIAAYLAGGSHR